MAVWRNDPELAARFHPQYPDHLQVLMHDGEPRRTRRQPEVCWVEVTALHGRLRFANMVRPNGAPIATERVHWVERPVYRGTLLHATHALATQHGQSLLFVVALGIPYPLQVEPAYLAERVGWGIRPCDRCGADQGLDPPSVMAHTRFGDQPGSSPVRFTAFCPCGGTMELVRLESETAAARTEGGRPVSPSRPPPVPRAPAPRPPPPPPPRAAAPSPAPAKPKTRWVWIPDPKGRALAFTYVDRTAGPSAKGAKIGDSPSAADIRRAIDEPDVTYRQPERFGAVPVSPEEALRLGLPKDPPWIGHFEPKPIPPPRGEPSREITGRVLHGGAPVPGARVRMGYAAGAARELVALDERATDEDGRFAFPLAPVRDVAVIADVPGMSSRLVDAPVEGPAGGPAGGSIDLVLEQLGAMTGAIQRAGVPVAAQVSLNGLDGGVHRVARSKADGRYRLDGLVPGRYEVTVEAVGANAMINGTRTFDEVEIVGGRSIARDFIVMAGTVVQVRVALPAGGDSASVFLVTGRSAAQRQSQLRPLYHTPALRSANSLSSKDGWLTTEFRDVVPGEYTVLAAPWDRSGDNPDPALVSRIVTVASAPQTVELALP